MIRLGLTGSIGMGKSTTARLFAEQGVPVYDADAAVHALYAGRAAPLVEQAFPGTVIDGKVDRALLGPLVFGKPPAMAQLEAIIHPLVKEEEAVFLETARRQGHRIVVLDIPLLFESGESQRTDMNVVVTASPDIQQERVMERPGMTLEKFVAIRTKQMPDAEKRRRAHFVIDTGHGLEPAKRSVAAILKALAAR
ncbi:dephospho-CoA kinase [Roseibium sp. RKSG952]|uniref:dephospho-CoA kinase n=1 Tax=Roseibium sp. RKSG952 TaxID=2529384 RepID=UPI0012BC4108|nr:dephospho-CoA kinase [Roseibium sp. RKSG952]MTI01099.1 dephospho-CoA kinase [Roseibium sp. RKSG952]